MLLLDHFNQIYIFNKDKYHFIYKVNHRYSASIFLNRDLLLSPDFHFPLSRSLQHYVTRKAQGVVSLIDDVKRTISFNLKKTILLRVVASSCVKKMLIELAVASATLRSQL